MSDDLVVAKTAMAALHEAVEELEFTRASMLKLNEEYQRERKLTEHLSQYLRDRRVV